MIWDSREDPPENAGQVYLWNGYQETHSVHSVLQYVEAHSERLRESISAGSMSLASTRLTVQDSLTRLCSRTASATGGRPYWWKNAYGSRLRLPTLSAFSPSKEMVVQRAPRELAAALDRAHVHPETKVNTKKLFFLDAALPRWSRLLSLGQSSCENFIKSSGRVYRLQVLQPPRQRNSPVQIFIRRFTWSSSNDTRTGTSFPRNGVNQNKTGPISLQVEREIARGSFRLVAAWGS